MRCPLAGSVTDHKLCVCTSKTGTWCMSVYMRALGAKVGSWVTFRYSNVQTAPDMLRIGDGTHVGDLANMVPSCALDADSILVAPIDIGKQVHHQLSYFDMRTRALLLGLPDATSARMWPIRTVCCLRWCLWHKRLWHAAASSACHPGIQGSARSSLVPGVLRRLCQGADGGGGAVAICACQPSIQVLYAAFSFQVP